MGSLAAVRAKAAMPQSRNAEAECWERETVWWSCAKSETVGILDNGLIDVYANNSHIRP